MECFSLASQTAYRHGSSQWVFLSFRVSLPDFDAPREEFRGQAFPGCLRAVAGSYHSESTVGNCQVERYKPILIDAMRCYVDKARTAGMSTWRRLPELCVRSWFGTRASWPASLCWGGRSICQQTSRRGTRGRWGLSGNLTKVRPLFTLSHRGSDNSQLQIMFKWTLYELCFRIYYVMISINQIAVQYTYFVRWHNCLAYFQSHCVMILTNQKAYFKCSALFLKMTKSFDLLSVA